jgi:hypothetical protein
MINMASLSIQSGTRRTQFTDNRTVKHSPKTVKMITIFTKKRLSYVIKRYSYQTEVGLSGDASQSG